MIIRKKFYTARTIIHGLILGMSSLLRSFFKRQFVFEKSITINYPLDQYHYSEKLFGMPILTFKENGDLNCTSCQLCVEICPTSCFSLKGEEGRAPKEFEFNVSQCVFCSYCEYVCPDQAIKMGPKHILSHHREESSVFKLKDWIEFSQ